MQPNIETAHTFDLFHFVPNFIWNPCGFALAEVIVFRNKTLQIWYTQWDANGIGRDFFDQV